LQALESIEKSPIKQNELSYYKGDSAHAKSALITLNFVFSVFNEDYNKIVNMEEIAEQS
jgi:hypothetical protein